MKIAILIALLIAGEAILAFVPGVHSGPLQLLWVVVIVMFGIKSLNRPAR